MYRIGPCTFGMKAELIIIILHCFSVHTKNSESQWLVTTASDSTIIIYSTVLHILVMAMHAVEHYMW